MGRILLAALFGGILEFAWGAVSHMVLGTTDAAFEQMPNESAVMNEIKATPPGFYGFPWIDHKNENEADKKGWEEAAKRDGVGILIRWPEEAATLQPSPRSMGLEFASNVLGALLLAMIGAGRGFSGRVMLGAMLGLFAFLSQNASYWIWYHFSEAFTKGELIDAVAGWTIAGVGVALVLRKKAGSG